MRELRTYGSERGALSNGRPYRDRVQYFQFVRRRRVARRVHREINENPKIASVSAHRAEPCRLWVLDE